MKPLSTALAIALWVVLLAGLLVAWSPLYWPFSVSLVGLCVVACVWAFSGAELLLLPEFVPALLVGAWGFLQILMGRTAVESMTLRSALTWTGCAVAFLLGANILSSRRLLSLFLRTALWTLTVLAAEAMLQFFISPQRVFGLFDGPDSVVGTLFYRNQFAALMEMGGAIALWQILRGRPFIGSLCFATMFAAVIATASRAGAALMAVEIVVFVFLLLRGESRNAHSRPVALLIVAFMLGGAAVVGTDTLIERFQDRDLFSTRRELRASTVRMVADRPLGFGLGTWRTAYPKYATLDSAAVANEAHNDWVQWMADGGIPFAVLILLIVVSAGAGAGPDAWGIGLVAVAVHCLVDYPMRTPAISFLWFTLAGAACATRRHRALAHRSMDETVASR